MPDPIDQAEEIKTTMNLRVLPSVKELARRAAKEAHQSLTAWLTTLIERSTSAVNATTVAAAQSAPTALPGYEYKRTSKPSRPSKAHKTKSKQKKSKPSKSKPKAKVKKQASAKRSRSK